MEWQPIETAPKGEQGWILVYGPDGIDIALFCDWGIDDEWRRYQTAEYNNDGCSITAPTHWMPLPSPPKGDKS